MNSSRNFEKLKESARRGPIVLFLGAGVMSGNPPLVPLWKDLLSRLLDYALDLRFGSAHSQESLAKLQFVLSGSRPSDSTDPRGTGRDMTKSAPEKMLSLLSQYELANFIKVLLGKQYLHILREMIYLEYNDKEPWSMKDYEIRNPFFHSVVELCRLQQISAVVTYNYDDILLTAVTPFRKAYPVWGNRQPVPENADLPIYHIHGYLPNTTRPPDSADAKIVLSLDEYFHNMMEPFSWQTTTQLHFLLNATCIFLGASLDDINMLRMLRYAKTYYQGQRAFAVMAEEALINDDVRKAIELRESGPVATKLQRLILRSKATVLDDAGATLILVPKYSQVSELVSELRQFLQLTSETLSCSNEGE